MEIFDVINIEDEVIGQATREECHSNSGLIHRAVHFTLVNLKEDTVLLTQRSFKKETDPGKLCFLGEHILAGEGWMEGVERGVREELGIKPGQIIERSSHLFRSAKQTELVRFFTAEWKGDEIVYDKDEIEKIEWKTVNELKAGVNTVSDMTRFWIENIDWTTT